MGARDEEKNKIQVFYKDLYKAMEEEVEATNEEKNKFQKKFQDLKKNCDPVKKKFQDSEDFQDLKKTIDPVTTVSGCYRGGKCNGSNGCCDCEMTQSDCKAERDADFYNRTSNRELYIDPSSLVGWIDNCSIGSDTICAVPVTT